MQTRFLKKVIFIFSFGVISLITKASPPEKIIYADSLFLASDYTGALNSYEEAEKQAENFANPSVFLKCAFITERFGDVPKTIYYLSRYNQIFPSVVITDKINSLANEAGLEGYNKNELNTLLTFIAANYFYFITAFLLIGMGLYYILFYKFYRNQKFLKRHSILLGIYLLGMLFVVNTPLQVRNLIVNSPKAELRKEPSGASTPIRTLKAGDRLIHLGNVDVWSRVKYENEIYFINSNNCWVLE